MEGITNQLSKFINAVGATIKPTQTNNKFAELVFYAPLEENNYLNEQIVQNEYGLALQSVQEVIGAQKDIVRVEDFIMQGNEVDINYSKSLVKSAFNPPEHLEVSEPLSIPTTLPIMEPFKPLQADKRPDDEIVPQMQVQQEISRISSEQTQFVEAIVTPDKHFESEVIASKPLTRVIDHQETSHIPLLTTLMDAHTIKAIQVDNVNQSITTELNTQIASSPKNNESSPVAVLDNPIDHSEIETAITAHSAISDGGNTVKAVSVSELYDQKWYSIGKLSYIDSDIQTLAKTATDRTNGTTDTLTEFELTSLLNNTAIFEYSSQASTSDAVIASSNYMQIDAEIFREPKKYASLAAGVVLNQLHEIEKKKISVLTGDEGQTLAVRDYTSSFYTLKEQVNQYLKHYENSISKITINGKTSN